MNLSHSQKKYLKKYLKKNSLEKIGIHLGLNKKEILQYLKGQWSKEKYQNFLAKQNAFREKISYENNSYNTTLDKKAWWNKKWSIIFLLGLFIFLIYLNSLGNDFVSDDIGGIKEHPLINQATYFWGPPFNFSLRAFLLFIIHKIFGLQPIFYRLVNIFFHIGSASLVYLVISFLTTPSLAIATAFVFAAHPILVESVTWISGGPYAQYGFFMLLSFWFYLLARRKNWQTKLYLFSIISFILAISSMERAIVFPFILFTYEIAFRNFKKNWLRLIPFFSISFLGLLSLLWGGALNNRITALETRYYQPAGMENPLIQIPVAFSSYFRLISWPDKLTLYHSELNFSQFQYLFMFFITLIFFSLIFIFYKKNRLVFFWLCFFIVILLPTLTPIKISWIYAERYVYLGTLGIIFPFIMGIEKIFSSVKKQKLFFVVIVIIVICLSIRTVIRNNDWKNQDNLWLAAAKTSPSSHQNHNNLGDLYLRRGNYQKAIEEFQRAVELKPDYGDAYHNLANVYHQIQKDDLALENYQKAIELNPGLWQSYQNIAAIYFKQQKWDLVEESIKKAIVLNPENIDLHLNLSIFYKNINQEQKAKEELEKALEIDSQDQKAQQLLKSFEIDQ
jgi:protein O-mannosyl-transferase